MKRINGRSMSASLLASCACLGLAVPAMAQDSDEALETAEVADPDENRDDIVVTGSRLPALDFETSSPVISIGEEVLENQGTTNLTEFLLQEPALAGSSGNLQTTNGFIGSTGLNLLNLRNLGISRTLVLVNGNRHITQLPNNSAVDINTIPVDLVERVDVVTGGVSAVYGADAVSGVVNFITRTDYEGIALRAQSGIGVDGEPHDYFATLTAGQNFADGRGNIAASFQYNHTGRLQTRDRFYAGPFAERQAFFRNPADEAVGDDPNIPDNILFEDIRFCDTAPNGGVFTSFSNSFVAPDFTGDGRPFSTGNAEVPPFYCSGGDGTRVSGYTGDLIGESDSYVGNVFLNYEFSPAARVFAEFKYARVDGAAQGQPSFDFFLGAFPDNPFMPDVIRNDLIFGQAFVSRDNFDLGRRVEETSRDTYRGVFGIKGELNEWLNYDVSYVYGRTDAERLAINNRFNDRWFAAIDVITNPVTGAPDCRINVDPTAIPAEASFDSDVLAAFQNGTTTFAPGECIPFNLFVNGAPTNLAAADWIMQDTLSDSYSEHHVASGYVFGNVPGFSLPGGDIRWVLGGEYRHEEAQSNPNAIDAAGLTFGNALQPQGGEFDVWEVYAEMEVPILADVPGAHELTLNLAGRLSDYSTIGGTETYNVGLLYAPVEDIRFRGTYAQSVRAPNTGELFGAQSQTFNFINDPCDIANIDNGSSTRAANCSSALTALGFNPATYTDPNSSSVAGVSGGNPNLSAETSTAWTAGVILTPTFVPGLSFAVDYFDITIADAVASPTAQEIADNCYDAPDLNNVFCANLTRSATNGGINNFIQIPQNVAEFKTAGVDFNLNWAIRGDDYGFDPAIGDFNIRLVGSYLDSLTFIPSPGAELDDDKGETGAPEWLATFDLTWVTGPVTVNYGYNYFSGINRTSNETLEANPDFFAPEFAFLPARSTHDIFFAFQAAEEMQFYAGMNNMFGQEPAIGLTTAPVSPVGRFFYAGVRIDL